jgi:diguanylate cyclase (GGDEF)-like protein
MSQVSFSSAVQISSSAVQALALQSTVAAYNENLKPADNNAEELWSLLGTAMTVLNHTHNELDTAHHQIQALQARISELERLTTTDTLTGLKNRRGFEEAFTQEMDRINRGQSKGGVVVLIDLDNFKAINDTYSHLAGDTCLKVIANALAQEIRTMDTAARFGGDEFVLLLSNALKDDILARIQKMSARLNTLFLNWYGTEINIRSSIGIQGFGKSDTIESVFHAADMAMYKDKAKSKMSAHKEAQFA